MKIYFQNNYIDNFYQKKNYQNRQLICNLGNDIFEKQSAQLSFKGQVPKKTVRNFMSGLSKKISRISKDISPDKELKRVKEKYTSPKCREIFETIFHDKEAFERYKDIAKRKSLKQLIQYPVQIPYLGEIVIKYTTNRYKKFLSLIENKQIKQMLKHESCSFRELHELTNYSDEKLTQFYRVLNHDVIKKIIKRNTLSGKDLPILAQIDDNAYEKMDNLFKNKLIKKVILSKHCDSYVLFDIVNQNKNALKRLDAIFNGNNKSIKLFIQNGEMDLFCLDNIADLRANEYTQYKMLLNNKTIQKLIKKTKTLSPSLLTKISVNPPEKFNLAMQIFESEKMQTLINKSKNFNENDIDTFFTFSQNELLRFNALLHKKNVAKLIQNKKLNFPLLSEISSQDDSIVKMIANWISNDKFFDIMNRDNSNMCDVNYILLMTKLTPAQLAEIPKILENKKLYNIISKSNNAFRMMSIFAQINDINFLNLPFKQKKELLESINVLIETTNDAESLKILEKYKNKVIQCSDTMTKAIKISQLDNQRFWHNFMTTASDKNLKAIQNLASFIDKYGKTGMPLKFSREIFVKSLVNNLEKLPKNKQEQILSKLQIQLTQDRLGYDGLINLYKLNKNDKSEKIIQQLCENFLLNNRIETGNKEVDRVLNSLIQGIPEFVNLIGKRHHGTHQYTIDCHILKVLQEMASHPEFEKLSNIDKTTLQVAVILHDIGKSEGKIDFGHEVPSAIIANDILEKFNLPVDSKKRIVELIKNHNWLQLYNTKGRSEKDIAAMFRRPTDFKLAKIFAEADLKGVGSNFFDKYSNDLFIASEKISKYISNIHSSGNLLFPTKILNAKKFPIWKYKGHDYRVLDLRQFSDEDDLRDFGLSMSKKSDLRFLFHKGEFETVQTLTKPFNDSVICSSLISPSRDATYFDGNVGILFDSENINIINMSRNNIGSGSKRNFKNFVEMLTEEERYRFKNNFSAILSGKYAISEKDFQQIYKQLVDAKYLTRIKDIEVNKTKIKKEDLIDAYKKIEAMLMHESTWKHNEVNLYNPNIKGIIVKHGDIESLNADTLKFIREHNLPIIILN